MAIGSGVGYDRRMTSGIEVGATVRMSDEPDWGIGQVQSIVGDRITVNFEHRGKLTLIGERVRLELIAPDDL